MGMLLAGKKNSIHPFFSQNFECVKEVMKVKGVNADLIDERKK